MKRLFIQTKEFESQLKAFGDHDELLVDIEQEVLKDLKRNMSLRDLIVGTGGFTKLRVPFRSQKRGKSGSARVIYFDCSAPMRTFLIMIYSKASFESFGETTKKLLKEMGKELKQWHPKKK